MPPQSDQIDLGQCHTYGHGEGSAADGQRYRGILHCIMDSVRAEGVTVLFRGLWLNSLRAFPVNAITFLSYESLVRALTSSDPTCSGP